MSAGTRPMRVEAVLQLLPEVDLLAPLRAMVMAASRGRTAEAPFLTVGKRIVEPQRFADLIPGAVQRFSEHLSALYGIAIEAMDAQERGDVALAVEAFLRASALEAHAGRDLAARAWLRHALRLAEGARNRRPEIAVLHALAGLNVRAGDDETAARKYQRCFALAEAEGDRPRAAAASIALGKIASRRGMHQGAESWFTKGLDFAAGDPALEGLMRLGLCTAHAERGDLVGAEEQLRLGESLLQRPDGDGVSSDAMVALASAQAWVAARAGRLAEADAHYREALAYAKRDRRDPRGELIVRIELCRFLLANDRILDAEDEARSAEEMAVAQGRSRELARLYVILGEIRGLQGDESGFVFFEQAIELSRAEPPTPRIEGEAYLAYARFRRVDEPDEARAYLERAREIFTTLGDLDAVRTIDEALRVSAGSP